MLRNNNNDEANNTYNAAAEAAERHIDATYTFVHWSHSNAHADLIM